MNPSGLLCAWCGRERTQGGDWRASDALPAAQPLATHGICPECLERETRAALGAGVTLPLLLDPGR